MHAKGKWIICEKTEGQTQTDTGLYLAPGTAASEYIVTSVGCSVTIKVHVGEKVLFLMKNAIASGNYVMVHQDDMIAALE